MKIIFEKSSLQKNSSNPQKSKKYKVLNNGTLAGKNAIVKKKNRNISSINRNKGKIYSLRMKKLKNQQLRFSREQSQLIAIAMGGVVHKKNSAAKLKKLITAAKKGSNIASKPKEFLKSNFIAQAEKANDSGLQTAKLGVEMYDYGRQGVKTAANTGIKTAKKTAKLSKRVYRKLHKPTASELRRKLKTRARINNHNLAAEADFLAKRAIKKGAAKAGKAAGEAMKSAAKASAKAAQASAKAIAGAAAKISSLIASTMPYSLIILAAVLIILIIALIVGSAMTSAGGTVAGGGAWLVNDSKMQTPEEIYKDYQKFIEEAKKVMDKNVQKSLEKEVDSWCKSDTKDPRRLIQYVSNTRNVTYYPANGHSTTIDSYIEAFDDKFDTEFYSNFLAVLFVLMTRDMQKTDRVTDETIYDFDFSKSDFEELIGELNKNSCKYGETYCYKTTQVVSGCTCPGQNCKTKTIPGCKCKSGTRVDDEGKPHTYYYCGGHPYCPSNHDKLVVTLYTIEDYHHSDVKTIYKFTDNENARFEAAKAIIQEMLDYWEE